MERVAFALLVVVGVPLATVAYILVAERLIAWLPNRPRAAIRPWLWLAPALLLLAVLLVYPTISTVYLSFLNANSTQPVGLDNYVALFTNPALLGALRNNLIWLVVFTGATVTLGLIIAVLTDRVRYEAMAKSIVFLPMAISFVAAGVIWRFMYDYRPPGAPQTGTVNAALMAALPGFEPQAWLINPPGNNLALIVAAVWVWTGFCLVILSAGLKGISTEVIEAARVDGAGEWQIFRRIIIPLLGPTLAVVTTTMIIFALKAFDIVYVMTNGNFDTEVLANRMYKEMFNVRDFGRASAIAVLVLVAIVPVMVFNIRRFRQQEEIR
ncbi:MAG TPA: sugar ABC transporter permease [Dehalococcoidia bacterium]|nr:sugar ABC transporter permease [Dehalococcoidia bacterium]